LEDYDMTGKNEEHVDEHRRQQWIQHGAGRADVAFDSVPGDCALNYVSTFGKIFTGETFKVLFTIMNTSANYALQNVRMRVSVQRES